MLKGKSGSEMEQEVNSGRFPPCLCYKILYTSPEERRVTPVLLKVDLLGANVHLTFSCEFKEEPSKCVCICLCRVCMHICTCIICVCAHCICLQILYPSLVWHDQTTILLRLRLCKRQSRDIYLFFGTMVHWKSDHWCVIMLYKG